MVYTGPERRKHPRIIAKFVVSYRIREDIDGYDISQTKNLGEGGMLLTTNKEFEPGTVLVLSMRLPFVSEPINIFGQVLESKKIVQDLIYDTRIMFIDIKENEKEAINKIVDFHLKKEK